jgi:hypothetical protein
VFVQNDSHIGRYSMRVKGMRQEGNYGRIQNRLVAANIGDSQPANIYTLPHK